MADRLAVVVPRKTDIGVNASVRAASLSCSAVLCCTCSLTHLVAKGLLETCGKLKNSSLSIVPELSYTHVCQPSLLLSHLTLPVCSPTLSNFINLFRNRSTSSLSTTAHVKSAQPSHVYVQGKAGRHANIQFDPATILSNTPWTVCRLLASYSAAALGSEVVGGVFIDMVAVGWAAVLPLVELFGMRRVYGVGVLKRLKYEDFH